MKRLIYQKLSTLIFILFLIAVSSSVPESTPIMGRPEKNKLAIIMYHGFTQNGKESTYVIKESEFEKDIVYLKENGFTFVGTEDILNYYNSGTLPGKKCVMITFDDGYLNNYVYAFPIIKKHGAKVVISPIGIMSDKSSANPDINTEYSHISWNQAREMAESNLAEIQNHSYNMHSITRERKGSAKSPTETDREYREIFYTDLMKAHNSIKEGVGKEPVAYVYPFGSISSQMHSVLKCCGYKMSLGCESGYNYLTGNKEELWNMKRFNRTNVKNVSQLLADY